MQIHPIRVIRVPRIEDASNQYNLVVEKDDYFSDLLFYNYHLHCFVVFELKVGDFTPEYTGKAQLLYQHN